MLRINIPGGTSDALYPEEEGVEYKYLQVMLQRALRFAGGVAPVMAVTLALSDYESLPTIHTPYKQIITAISINGAIIINDALRAVATQEQPLAYLRKVGDGSAGAGFRKMAWRTSAAFVLPIAAATAYGVTLYNICNAAKQAGDMNKMVVCATLEGSFMNVLLVGAPAWLLYGMTKKMIDCCISLPVQKVKEHPVTLFAQDLLNSALRLTDSFVQAEFIREVLLVFSPPLAHMSFMPLLPAFWDQFVLAPLKYLAYQPKPMKNTVPKECEPQHSEEYYTKLLENPTFDRKAGGCTRGKWIAFYTVSATVSLGMFAGLHYFYLDQLMEERDPETMPEWKRLSYEAGLLAGCFLVNKTINAIPNAVGRLRNWCSGLTLFGAEGPRVNYSEEEEFITNAPVALSS